MAGGGGGGGGGEKEGEHRARTRCEPSHATLISGLLVSTDLPRAVRSTSEGAARKGAMETWKSRKEEANSGGYSDDG